MTHGISGYSYYKMHSFYYFLSQQLSLKNEQKVQFQASSSIHVAMKTKIRCKTKLACLQLFKFDALYAALTKVCTFVFYGRFIP